jgi:hypothetical protein
MVMSVLDEVESGLIVLEKTSRHSSAVRPGEACVPPKDKGWSKLPPTPLIDRATLDEKNPNGIVRLLADRGEQYGRACLQGDDS